MSEEVKNYIENTDFNKYKLVVDREYKEQYIQGLEQENQQLKERIDKADKDIQKLLDDINTKTIIGLNSFIPRLEVIQDELVGGNNE